MKSKILLWWIVFTLTLILIIGIDKIYGDPAVIIFDGEIEHQTIVSSEIDILRTHQSECIRKMQAAHVLAEAARALGYEEHHPIIILAGKEWTAWNKNWKIYDEQITKLKKTETAKTEYQVAYTVWFTLKENGYTDESIAAILGNMMVECGGHTLALNYKAYNNSGYYGLCQWSKKYYPEVQNTSLEFQMNWLLKTIAPDFCNETDVESAAIRFAKEYERCSATTYEKRAQLALVAYDYFKEVGENE